MADVNVVFKFDVKGDPSKPIKQVEAKVKDVEKSFLSLKTTAGDIFKGTFGAQIAVKALDQVIAAGKQVVQFLGESVDAAKEAEQAQAAFAFAISDTETNVAAATARFSNFADGLSQVTAFEDEAIIKSGALIGTLTRLSGEGLQNATKASADLAAALGIDLEQASTLVAKAANGNTAAFGKLGIEIKKGNTDAETFANTLQALSRFQGAAEAKSQTFAGAQARLSNTFGNLQEELGNTIVKNQAFVNAINAVQGILVNLIEYLKLNGPRIGENIAKGFKIAVDATGVLILAIKPAIELIDKAVSGISFLVTASTASLARLGEKVAGTGGVFTALATSAEFAAEKSAGSFDTAFDKGLIDDFSESLGKISVGLEQGIGKSAKTAADSIKGTLVPAVKELSEEQKRLGEEGQKIAQDAAKRFAPELDAQRQIDAVKAAAEQKKITELELGIAIDEIRSQAAQREAEQLIAQNEALLSIDAEKNASEIAANDAKLQALLDGDTLYVNQKALLEAKILESRKKREEKEKELDRQRLTAVGNLFGAIASAASVAGKDAFELQKAAATAQAIIQGYLAVQTALASAPPPFGAIAAIGVGIQAAANISRINSTNLATGITEVPSGFPNDSFPANLTSGERVLSVEQNQDLKSFMNRNDSSQTNALLGALVERVDRLQNTIIVNIGEKEVFNVLRDGINSGRAFA